MAENTDIRALVESKASVDCDHFGAEKTIAQCALCPKWCCDECLNEHLEDEHGAA